MFTVSSGELGVANTVHIIYLIYGLMGHAGQKWRAASNFTLHVHATLLVVRRHLLTTGIMKTQNIDEYAMRSLLQATPAICMLVAAATKSTTAFFGATVGLSHQFLTTVKCSSVAHFRT